MAVGLEMSISQAFTHDHGDVGIILEVWLAYTAVVTSPEPDAVASIPVPCVVVKYSGKSIVSSPQMSKVGCFLQR
jgi:DNA mismatch repair protein MutH